MWQRFTFYDFRVIGHYLGDLILLVSATLLIPFATALVFQEWEPASRYLYTLGIGLCIGCLMCLMRATPGQLNRQQALAVTGFAWIVLALIGAIPLFGSGHYGSYLDALFDSVSGFTSTGASIITDLDHLSNADNMWRFLMHFLGGLGLVVVMLSLGMAGRGGSSSLYSSEGRSEHVVPNVVQTARLITRIAVVIIAVFGVVLGVICLFDGMEPTRAFLHGLWIATSAFMTAGFTPMSSSIYYYHSLVMEIVLMVLMLLGGINFALYASVWKGRTVDLFRDTEIRTTGIWLLLLTVVITLSLSASTVFSSTPGIMRRGLFMLFAAASTTGFQNVTSNELTTVFASGAILVLALASSVGLGAGSTAGGIKVRRLAIIFKSVMSTLKQTASPESLRVVTTYYHVGRRVINESMVKEAMTIFTLFIVMYAIGTLAGIAYGYDATSAIFDSVMMASNGGLSAGICSPDMPAALEALYIVEMWAGRLEFVTLFALVIKIFVSFKPRLQEDE